MSFGILFTLSGRERAAREMKGRANEKTPGGAAPAKPAPAGTERAVSGRETKPARPQK